MQPDDINTLTLGTKLYWHTMPIEITEVTIKDYGRIRFKTVDSGEEYGGLWSYLCPDINREPAEQSKRFWRWQICHQARWVKPSEYLDENGYMTDGIRNYYPGVWEKYPKRKLEEDFVDL